MGLYINPGNEAFQISLNDDIYIDQSGILAFTNNRIGKRKRYLCVSRPRRFGKSLTAEMLQLIMTETAIPERRKSKTHDAKLNN